MSLSVSYTKKGTEQKNTSQYFSKPVCPSPALILFVVLILLSGCVTSPSKTKTVPGIVDEPEPANNDTISITWNENVYRGPNKDNTTRPHLKIVRPEAKTYRWNRLQNIQIEANDTGQALSYILLDEDMNLLDETAYKPVFNHTPKRYGKQAMYLLAVYPDGQRGYDMFSFKIEDKKEDFKRVCNLSEFQFINTSRQTLRRVVDCDIVVEDNQTLEIRNATTFFKGADKSLFYDFPNQSIGYEIRVKAGGRLIVYNSSFKGLNGYWNGFIFEEGAIVDWYYNDGIEGIDNVNISYAFRVGEIHQQIGGFEIVYLNGAASWFYPILIFKEKYEILENGIFYKTIDTDVHLETERSHRMRRNVFAFDKIFLSG